MRATPLGNCALSVPFPAAMKPRSTKFSTSRNSSDSAESDSVAENFSENDEDYADSTIVEAVEVRSGPEGCTIKMRNGDVLKCVHNSNEAGTLPVYDPHPAIVLHLNDSSNLLLPIIVLEFPSAMLSDAIRNVEPTRPTVYQVMSNILEVSGYKAKLVRVTKRVNETYFARVHLVKEGDDSAPPMSLDIRPSDAINLAVRCKIPIQVSKNLAMGDGVRVVTDVEKLPSTITTKDGLVITDLDTPLPGPCLDAEEFVMVRDMHIAAVEERFIDAGKLRDELEQFRKAASSESLEQNKQTAETEWPPHRSEPPQSPV